MKQGWEYKKIGNICNITTGKLDANAANEDGLYPFFTCSRIPLSINTYAYDCECILIAGNGDLNVKYYNGKFNAYQRTYILQLKNDVNGVEMRYIFAFFNLYIEELRRKSIGGIIKYIKLGDLTNALLPLPDITTQLSIVSELDKINELIRLKKEQLKDYDNLAQSIFYEMFGDPVENDKGWEVKKLGEVSEFKNGLNFNKIEDGHLIKFLGVSDFQNKRNISSDTLGHISLLEEVSEDYFLKTDDIVFVRSNGNKELIGRCVKLTITEPTTYSGFCIRCRITDEMIDKEFVACLMKIPTIKQLMTNSGRGCNISNLNQKVLGSIPIICPKIELQHLFAQRIEQIERQKSAVQKAITDLETLLASRMQHWFE